MDVEENLAFLHESKPQNSLRNGGYVGSGDQTVKSLEMVIGPIVAVVVGALIAGVFATMNLRHQRATRWDEPRRLIYSRFLEVLTEVNDAGHAELLARFAKRNAPDSSLDKTAAADYDQKVERLNEASMRLYLLKAEVTLLATAPVVEAASAAIQETTNRLGVVETVFEDVKRSNEIGEANVAWEQAKDRFIEAASRELGIRKSR